MYFFLPSYAPTQADVSVYENIGKPPAEKFAHALRWYNHITSFGAEKSKFPGAKKPISNNLAPVADEDDDDDEVDLFGSDDDEEEVCIL